MKTENLIAKSGLFYVLSIVLGALVSWKYCGCELMFVSFYYMARAMWNELKGMLNDLKTMR